MTQIKTVRKRERSLACVLIIALGSWASKETLTTDRASVSLAAQASDPAASRVAFTNLVRAYGRVTTIAGAGGSKRVNNWRPEFEGVPAIKAVLSGPHIAIGDRWGQIYIAVWYVDTVGCIHLFLNGRRNGAHAGNGTWFYNPAEFRVSECRAVTVDYAGNLLITENDLGYIRKVESSRLDNPLSPNRDINRVHIQSLRPKDAVSSAFFSVNRNIIPSAAFFDSRIQVRQLSQDSISRESGPEPTEHFPNTLLTGS